MFVIFEKVKPPPFVVPVSSSPFIYIFAVSCEPVETTTACIHSLAFNVETDNNELILLTSANAKYGVEVPRMPNVKGYLFDDLLY